jgi:hypothetical protein
MFRGDRPVGTVSRPDEADDRTDWRAERAGAGSADDREPDATAGSTDARGTGTATGAGTDPGSRDRGTTTTTASGSDAGVGAPGRRPPAAAYEARIAELEATVAGLEAELERQADEHEAVVSRYEQLLAGERAGGEAGDGDGDARLDRGSPKRDGRGTAPGLVERLRSLFE